MAKRELGTKNKLNAPTVRISDKAGTKFVGCIKKSFPTKYGLGFNFTIKDGDMSIQTKNEKGEFVEASVKPGDEVTVFASGQLKDKLALAQEGDTVEIVYNGKKLNPKSGRSFNDFTVSVIE